MSEATALPHAPQPLPLIKLLVWELKLCENFAEHKVVGNRIIEVKETPSKDGLLNSGKCGWFQDDLCLPNSERSSIRILYRSRNSIAESI